MYVPIYVKAAKFMANWMEDYKPQSLQIYPQFNLQNEPQIQVGNLDYVGGWDLYLFQLNQSAEIMWDNSELCSL